MAKLLSRAKAEPIGKRTHKRNGSVMPAELRIAFKRMDAICDRLHGRVEEYSRKHSSKP